VVEDPVQALFVAAAILDAKYPPQSNLTLGVMPSWMGGPKVGKCPKLLNQFNSVDSLIQNAGTLARLKGGKLMGTVTGDGEAMFKAITQGGRTLPSGYVKLADGTIVGKHIASSTGEFTIDINKAGTIYKIRVNP
jgi:hypothetical protein